MAETQPGQHLTTTNAYENVVSDGESALRRTAILRGDPQKMKENN